MFASIPAFDLSVPVQRKRAAELFLQARQEVRAPRFPFPEGLEGAVTWSFEADAARFLASHDAQACYGAGHSAAINANMGE